MQARVICLFLLCATAWAQDAGDSEAQPADTGDETKPDDSGTAYLRIPPSITVGPEETYQYRDMETVTLPCSASGTPEPTIEWRKDGAILNVNTNQITQVEGNLEITASYEQQGYYQCVAFNQHGKSMSNTAFLQMARLSSTSTTDTKNYPAVEFDKLKVECHNVISVPDAGFSWSLVRDTDDENPALLRLNSRIQLDENGNLYFAYVTKQDAEERKLYKCNAFNSIMDTTQGGSYSNLSVTASTVKRRKPTLQYSTRYLNDPIVVLLGEDLHIKCLFAGTDGKEAPHVSWEKIGGLIPGDRKELINYETELVIKKVEYSDEGKYKCTGSLSTFSPASDTITVDVQAKPTFRERPRNQNATEGDNFVFKCTADAEPAASIQWYINGDPLDPDSMEERREISSDGTELTIRSLCKDCPNDKTDLMVVQCNASNVHGYVFADGYLNVLLPTVITVSPVSVTLDPAAEEFEDVRYECEASSDQSTPVEITWYHNDEEIFFPEEHLILEENNRLFVKLEGVEKDDLGRYVGTYTCVASNGYSDSTASAELDIPGVKPIVEGGFDWWWIILIIVILLLLLILLLCCCLCIQRNKGDTYPVDEKERANGNDPEKELVDSGFHDYQRPEEGPIKGSRASLSSTIKLDSDDEGSLNEYGDIDAGKFNEDGSFIGQYATDKKKKPPTDSTV